MCLILLGTGTPAVLSIQTTLPQNNIQLTEEEAFGQSAEKNFFSFITTIIRFFKGETTSVPVSSKNVRDFSSAVKNYQAAEAKNDPDYENSHAKEKTDFGLGILEIIAGILTFFGL